MAGRRQGRRSGRPEVTAPSKVAAVNEGDAADSSDVTDNRDTADAPAGSHRFRIDITEVILTQVSRPADHLVIESWHPDRGLRTQRRH